MLSFSQGLLDITLTQLSSDENDRNGLAMREQYYLYPDEGTGVFVGDRDGMVHLTEAPRFPANELEVAAGGCVAPMPGRVVSVSVSIGQRVTQGQTLVVLEAMKMEQAMTAAVDGVALR